MGILSMPQPSCATRDTRVLSGLLPVLSGLLMHPGGGYTSSSCGSVPSYAPGRAEPPGAYRRALRGDHVEFRHTARSDSEGPMPARRSPRFAPGAQRRRLTYARQDMTAWPRRHCESTDGRPSTSVIRGLRVPHRAAPTRQHDGAGFGDGRGWMRSAQGVAGSARTGCATRECGCADDVDHPRDRSTRGRIAVSHQTLGGE